MRAFFKGLPLALACAFLLAACGGSGGGGYQTSGQSQDDASQPLVTNATDVLGTSAERFQEEVESVRAEMRFSMEAGGFSVAADAEMAFQAPDKAHITMQLDGDLGAEASELGFDLSQMGGMEILLLGTDVYMKIPFQGWVVTSLEDLGVEAETFEGLLFDHSPLDYRKLIEELGVEVEDLGQETLDGSAYNHYRATLELADLMEAFSDAFSGSFGGGDGFPAQDASGPMTIDVWVDPESLLPYRLAAAGDLNVGEELGDFVFDFTMTFSDYNQPVDIPEPPANALPLDGLSL